MLFYILKFSFCLAIFLAFYKLFLEKENIHFFKRYYLLGAIVFALSIPLMTFSTYVDSSPITPIEFASTNDIINVSLETPVITTSNTVSLKNHTTVSYWVIILWSIYGLGVFIFGFKFIKNLSQLIYKIKYNPKHITSNVTNVLLKENIIPHTFLRYIFFNKQKFETQKIPQEVLWHEETHVKQKHSLDVLLIEVLQVLFWFNPLIYFTKNVIKLNHEFLADQGVLNKGIIPKTYQHILLAFSANKSESDLVSAINYSLIKKRFTVMKTTTSKRAILLRSLILLPLLAITLYSFSNRTIAIKEASIASNIDELSNAVVVGSQFESNNASDALMAEYRAFITEFKKTNIINQGKYKRAFTIYHNLMSDAQRNSVDALPKTIIGVDSNLAKVKEKQPSKSEFESWKNKTNYAVWLDGKVIDNSKLNSLNHTDIVYYSDSFIYKNARSERFSQTHQVSLFTKKGFNETYKKSRVNAYKKLSKTYSEQVSQFLKGGGLDNSELKILYYQGDALYKKISKENIDKYNVRPLAPVPAQQKSQKKTPNKQANAKVLNTPNKAIVLLEDWHIIIDGEKYYYPYKGDLKKYYDKNGKEVVLDVIKEYKKKYNLLEQLKNETPHYVHKTKVEQEKMEVLNSDLGGMFFRLTRANKNKVSRPKGLLSPYIRLKNDDGVVYYKKRNELTKEDKALLQKLPPPPPPARVYSNSSNSKAKGGPNNTDEENYNITSLTSKPVSTQKKTQQKTFKKITNTREEFLKKLEIYEAFRYKKPHFLKKSRADRKLMNDLWQELRQMLIYYLPKEEKKGLDYPITPFAPYVRVNYDGKSYYKISNQLTSDEKKVAFSPSSPFISNKRSGLDLLDEDDPIIIPIGSYTLEPSVIEKEGNKRYITITVSKDGEYAISKDRSYKNFKETSLTNIEDIISKLSPEEIKNTFVFSKSNDFKKFRSKPAKTPEYQDDIEIKLIKTDIRFPIHEFEGKYYETISTQLALDNSDAYKLKPHVQALVNIFKKHGITNITM